MKTKTLVLISFFLVFSLAKAQIRMEENVVDGTSNYPYDFYPQLNGIELLIERQVTNNIEKGFNEHYYVFKSAENLVQNCVYCYFVDGSDKYQELLNYSSQNYKQVFLLLIRNMFNSPSSSKSYNDGRMPPRDPFMSLIFEGLYYKVFPNEYKQLLKDNGLFIPDKNLITRWDLPEYKEAEAIYVKANGHNSENYKVFLNILLTNIMGKCKR